MANNISRRSFVGSFAVVAGLLGLSGCDGSSASSSNDAFAAPSADSYPIEADDSSVEAKWTSETSRKDKWTKVTNPDGGPELGVMDTANIIQVDGMAFRDMNGNGKLDLWEDWRQPAEDRAKALAEELSIEEISGLMWHPTYGGTGTPADDLLERVGKGVRVALSRASTGEKNYVEAINWVNALQEECEKSEHGVPFMVSTDPYTTGMLPDCHGLTATFDADIWKKAGMYTGRTWRALGYHINLGPQVDVGSNPIWSRYSATICEDPATNRDFCKAYAGGMQSTWSDDEASDDQGWGKDSIAVVLKHYVGAGASEGGRNDHAAPGKYDVFPGDNFNAHLIPFLDGGLNLDSKTGQMASVMPNYSIAYSEDEKYGELVAGAYNKHNIGILRNAGWDGMVLTDWGVYADEDKPWGTEDLTRPERLVKMLDATVDQVGNDFYPDDALEAYEIIKAEDGETAASEKYHEVAYHILTLMSNLGLFDNPYCDRDHALEVLNDEEAAAFAQEAADKSIVMLKNAGNVIAKGGITGKPKCYIPQKLISRGTMFNQEPATFELSIDEELANELFDVVTDTIGEPTGVMVLPGPPGEQQAGGDPQYQESDRTYATAEELAQCEYAVLVISSPNLGEGDSEKEDGTIEYLPVSLQYRPYTATTAREVSISGDVVNGVKENRSYKGKTVTVSNESDLDFVISTKEALPETAKLILIVEGANPQCFHEIEPYADVILWVCGSNSDGFGKSYAHILSGEAEPTALLPCQMPKDMDAVEAQLEDVPRDMECYTDSEGNTYDFCFGMNWSGVIDDERTKTYKVEALTEPETEVVPA